MGAPTNATGQLAICGNVNATIHLLSVSTSTSAHATPTIMRIDKKWKSACRPWEAGRPVSDDFSCYGARNQRLMGVYQIATTTCSAIVGGSLFYSSKKLF
jgi:hypothetical protein